MSLNERGEPDRGRYGWPADFTIIDDPAAAQLHRGGRIGGEPEPAEFDREAWMARWREMVAALEDMHRTHRRPVADPMRIFPRPADPAGRLVALRPATAVLRGRRHEIRPTDVVLPRAEAERRLAEFVDRWVA